MDNTSDKMGPVSELSVAVSLMREALSLLDGQPNSPITQHLQRAIEAADAADFCTVQGAASRPHEARRARLRSLARCKAEGGSQLRSHEAAGRR